MHRAFFEETSHEAGGDRCIRRLVCALLVLESW
jgi:hypothetical protein